MGWSTTAPTLPAGASWSTEQASALYDEANHWTLQAWASIARISATEVAIKVRTEVNTGRSGEYWPPDYYYLWDEVDGYSHSIAWGSKTQVLYWTGQTSGNTVEVGVGGYNTSASIRWFELAVPAQLGPDIRVRQNNTWTKITGLKVGGTSITQAKVLGSNGQWQGV